MTIFPFLVIFPLFLHPTTQPQLLTTNVLSLGPITMIFMKKKLRQIHNKSITSGIKCQLVAKIGQIVTVFSTFAHCHGPPYETFSFFLAMMCWVEGSSSDFKQQVRNHFIFFFSFFLDDFCLFFHFFNFWPILHISRPPMVNPLSPVTPFRTFMSPESN